MINDIFQTDDLCSSTSSECLIRKGLGVESPSSSFSDKTSKLDASSNQVLDSFYKPEAVPVIVLGTSFVRHALVSSFSESMLDFEGPLSTVASKVSQLIYIYF